MKPDETSVNLPPTISPQENYVNLRLLKQRVNALEAEMLTVKEVHPTKADLELLKKDVEQIGGIVQEIKIALEPMKDFGLVRKLVYAVVGLVLMGFVHIVGQAMVKFISVN